MPSSTRDVTERNQSAAALATARDQALEAANLKAAFLANNLVLVALCFVVFVTKVRPAFIIATAPSEQMERSGNW